VLSIPLVIIISIVSSAGLFTSALYQAETLNWQAQSKGQDIMDLFVVLPVLLLSAIMAYSGHPAAKWTWSGTNLYLLYSFLIYAFDVHFNAMFVFYCLALGLSFYSVLYFLYREFRPAGPIHDRLTAADKITGVYCLVTAILFYVLWLSDVVTAILYKTLPAQLQASGLPTNPVQVIDLSIILPAIGGTGILLLRRHRLGFLLAPVILVFILLMNLTIAGLNLVMKYYQLEVSWPVSIIMITLAVFNFYLLTRYNRVRQHQESISHAT
jgi:hypothetical protein